MISTTKISQSIRRWTIWVNRRETASPMLTRTTSNTSSKTWFPLLPLYTPSQNKDQSHLDLWRTTSHQFRDTTSKPQSQDCPIMISNLESKAKKTSITESDIRSMWLQLLWVRMNTDRMSWATRIPMQGNTLRNWHTDKKILVHLLTDLLLRWSTLLITRPLTTNIKSKRRKSNVDFLEWE